jgi:hypothetical protein
MQFDGSDFKQLHSLFAGFGLKAIGESAIKAEYVGNGVAISLAHDARENSNTLWVGRESSSFVEIDDQVVSEYFASDVKLSHLPQALFFQNVLRFFLGEGKELLNGNRELLIGLERFRDQRSRAYTSDLVKKQLLAAANSAWDDGNYAEFIRHFEALGSLDVPESMKMKYRIAKDRNASDS